MKYTMNYLCTRAVETVSTNWALFTLAVVAVGKWLGWWSWWALTAVPVMGVVFWTAACSSSVHWYPIRLFVWYQWKWLLINTLRKNNLGALVVYPMLAWCEFAGRRIFLFDGRGKFQAAALERLQAIFDKIGKVHEQAARQLVQKKIQEQRESLARD